MSRKVEARPVGPPHTDAVRIGAPARLRWPFCPRIRLRLTDSPMPDDKRIAGEGTLDQVRADLAALESLGARHVLLDTYTDDPEATRNHEEAWRMLATLAERAVDLSAEKLR